MRQTLLAIVLLLLLGAPAFAQPDITGTWSGTATVLGDNGYDTGQNVELEVTSQSGNLWEGTLLVQGYGYSTTASGGHRGTVGTVDGSIRVYGQGYSWTDFSVMVVNGQYIPADSPEPEKLVVDVSSTNTGTIESMYVIFQVELTK